MEGGGREVGRRSERGHKQEEDQREDIDRKKMEDKTSTKNINYELR